MYRWFKYDRAWGVCKEAAQVPVIFEPPCIIWHQYQRDLPPYTENCGPGSSVGIATELRTGRSGDRIPVGATFFSPIQTGPGAHPASCTMGTGSFLGVKCGRGVMLTPHPLLVPRSKNRVELYLYSPSGTSWPTKRVKPTYWHWKLSDKPWFTR
jgi:hypothetical protein